MSKVEQGLVFIPVKVEDLSSKQDREATSSSVLFSASEEAESGDEKLSKNNSAQSQAWVQVCCMGSTPPALTPPCYPAKPVVEITQRPARASKCTHVKSPSPSLTPPPSTSGASSSNSAPPPSTSSSPPSLPSLSNAEMLVVLREALCTTTEVLDRASKGHIASEKVLGKRKSRN
ncbi:hypothetical protein BKA82DRAFT_4365167 [Pisolithus tinctorius]|nr:hypothetical protein BKA82DRAFT_4365167 [Pisolithus tinctorius]